MTRTSCPSKAAILIALCVGEVMTASAASTWTLQFPGGSVDGNAFPIQLSHSAVYDPGTNTMIVFGGIDVLVNASSNGVSLLSNANGLGGTPSWSTLLGNGLL